MNIALIGNKTINLRNNGRLIDSCDLVVRVNKMCNLDTHLTGRRTDWLVTTITYNLWCHTREERHADLIPTIGKVFIDAREYPFLDIKHKAEVDTWNAVALPFSTYDRFPKWTTAAIALRLLHETYPEAHIYFAGQDSHTTWLKNRDLITKHEDGQELPYYKYLEDKGVVEFLDAEIF